MFTVECFFFCPDGIIPSSDLTGSNNIYIYILFDPVKSELEVIPSGQKKSFNREHLNFLGKELNVTDITEQ